jgi:hypothetical protein
MLEISQDFDFHLLFLYFCDYSSNAYRTIWKRTTFRPAGAISPNATGLYANNFYSHFLTLKFEASLTILSRLYKELFQTLQMPKTSRAWLLITICFNVLLGSYIFRITSIINFI